MTDKDKMREVVAALKEQARHISSLRSGMGTSDAIQAHDELVDMLVAAAKESSSKELEAAKQRIAELERDYHSDFVSCPSCEAEQLLSETAPSDAWLNEQKAKWAGETLLKINCNSDIQTVEDCQNYLERMATDLRSPESDIDQQQRRT